MEVKAQVKNLRVSPRKARLVVDLVRGMSVENALAQLRFVNKGVATDIAKLIKSARANATHNYTLDPSALVIKKMWVDEGVTLKRWMPRAFGRATPLRKRASHITVVVGVDGDSPVKVKADNEKEGMGKDDKLGKAEKLPKENKPKNAAKETKKKKETDSKMKGKHQADLHKDKKEKKEKGGSKKTVHKDVK